MKENPVPPLLKLYYAPSLSHWEGVRRCASAEGLRAFPLEALGGADPLPGLASVVLLGSAKEARDVPIPPDATVYVLGDRSGEGAALPEGWIRPPAGVSADDFLEDILSRWPYLATTGALARLRQEFDAQALILDQLTEVSLALSSERNYRRLLSLILSRALLLAGCDAGSLYLTISEEDGAPQRMLFAAVQNDSVAIPFKETELYISKSSLAGYVASTGETLVIDDSYAIPPQAPYRHNRAYDEQVGYRTKSQLVIPMLNQKGEITGVLQLINKKRSASARLTTPEAVDSEVIPFDAATCSLMRTVGSLAAVAIDNNRLYENIERLFEGFVRASVTAIEQRDPTTSGHSLRVSILTVDLAEAVDRTPSGPLAPFRFGERHLRELRYAALLHDFGKVGVREHVLVKAKKLYPFDLERVLTRLETARLCAEREVLLRKVERLAKGGGLHDVEALDRELAQILRQIDAHQEVILRANEPTVLPEGDFSALQAIAEATYRDRGGHLHPLLEADEMRVLSIRKGSLSEEERLEIESHVTHTYHFLKKIPWTPELRGVPEIAYAHHEKLNGAGYPRRVTGGEIPVQSRMMTVSDIFDALSASDRPYKKAVPVERALDILQMEVKDGMLDGNLVDLFIEAKCYEKTLHLRAGARL
jgi:HD-GYP domain-containing protein (c-di-GMP phosphodiesterase class II)